MPSTSPSARGSDSGDDAVAAVCAEIFRDMEGLRVAPDGGAIQADAELLDRSFDSFGLDSLSVMEFVMTVEERFDVELDETAVNECKTIRDLAGLVSATRDV